MEQNTLYHLAITLPFFLLIHVGLFGIFKKAGVEGWKALIPVYNVKIWLELVGRPKWWLVLFIIPVLNFIMGITIILDLLRSFERNKFRDHALAVIFPYFYFPWMGFISKAEYKGKWVEIHHQYKQDLAAGLSHKYKGDARFEKGSVREWLDAILFAGTAAILIRTFLIEAFMIPTTSMEGSLLAGDFLFVNKYTYGVRLPMVPLSMPFVHNTLPFTQGTKSYMSWPTLPYARMPGLRDVERYDIVVFNYPDDDEHPDVPALGPIKEVSMKQNYIKRCVAVPGDSLRIRNRQLYINGEKGWEPEFIQYEYLVAGVGKKALEDIEMRVGAHVNNSNARLSLDNHWVANLTSERINALQSKYPEVQITPTPDPYRLETPEGKQLFLSQQERLLSGNPLSEGELNPKYAFFPKAPRIYQWTNDNFGPLWVPKKGSTITLNDSIYPLYRKCIEVYEHNEVKRSGKNQFVINGEETSTYTFQMDYYFMMGDNRNQSLDSRYWGFVPEDHIVGRPMMILFSWENGPRWDRFFNFVSKFEP